MISPIAETQIESLLESALKKQELAGTNMLVVHRGKEIYYHQQGYADVEESKEISRNNLFRLYSMSKPITAAAVMLLMERGAIDLFDMVRDYLPGFKGQRVNVKGELRPPNRPVGIQDLLNMTSGLLYGGMDQTGKQTEALLKEMDRRLLGDNPMTTLEFANGLGKIPLAFHPGESWAYGTSADVLGALVEVVSGKSLGTFLQEELFEPLGMEDTGFYVPPEKQNRLAKTYRARKNKDLDLYQGNHLGIISAMDRQPAFESGGAGLVSTIDDYMQFAQMLMNRGKHKHVQIMKPATVDFFTTAVLSNDNAQDSFQNWHTLEGHSYGNLMRKAIAPEKAGMLTFTGEYGWDGWLGCHFANFPKEELTLLMMMQKTDAGTTSLTRRIRNILLSDISS